MGCHGRVKSFSEASRTVWFCPGCQSGSPSPKNSSRQVFHSKCASEPLVLRKSNPLKLSVKELRSEIEKYGLDIPKRARKADLVKILSEHKQDLAEHTADYMDDSSRVHGYNQRLARVEKKKKKKKSKTKEKKTKEKKKRKTRPASKVRRSSRRRRK